MTPDMIPWVVARASGVVAYALLAAAMCAGLVTRGRIRLPGARPAEVVDLHRLLSLAALVATAVHGAALVADTEVDITPLALVIPGLVPYRPAWVAAGVIAAELALVVQVTSLLRRRIGAAAWRRLHLLAYAAFGLATAHGVVAGTDTARPWALGLYGGATAAVAALTGWRVAVTAGGSTRARPVREHAAVGGATAGGRGAR